MMKQLKLLNETWRFDMLFVWDCSHDEFRKVLKKKYDYDLDEAPEEVRGQCVAGVQAIWLKRFNNSPEEVGSLVHETLHLCEYIFDIKVSRQRSWSDEYSTYLQEWMVISFLKNYKKHHGKRTNTKTPKGVHDRGTR